MKSIKFKFQKLSIFLLLIIFSHNSYACRCVGKISTSDAYNRASVVLIGSVVSMTKHPYKKGGVNAYIDVEKVWKKPISTSVEVHTSSSCAFGLKLGEQYLLYLYEGKNKDDYIIRACQGNSLALESKATVEWLEKNGTIMKVSSSSQKQSPSKPCDKKEL